MYSLFTSKAKSILLKALGIICMLAMFFFATKYIVEIYHAKADNPNSIGTNVIASLIAAVITTILTPLFKTFSNRLTLLFPGKRKEELTNLIHSEKEYLENLIERFRKEFPWEVDKYTNVEATAGHLNSTGRAGKLKSIANSNREDFLYNELRGNVDILDFLDSENGAVMLKGEPGTGKTLTARRYATNKAQQSLKNLYGNSAIPIYVSLNAYNSSTNIDGEPAPFFAFVQNYLKNEFKFAGHIVENLQNLLIKGRFVIILDGLNEMPPADFDGRLLHIEDFLFKQYPKNKAIITCRTLRITSLYRYKTIEINELNDEQIQSFIAAYRGAENVQHLFNEISAMSGIALKKFRNPFILRLYLLRKVFRETPDTLGKLYAEYIEDALHEVKGDKQIIEQLKQISFAMQNNGLFAGDIDKVQLEGIIGIKITQNFMSKCAAANLIDYSNTLKFKFYHQIFQEYFSALVLDEMYKKNDDYTPYLKQKDWEETILLWGGIVDDQEPLLTAICGEDGYILQSFCLSLKLCAVNPAKRVEDIYCKLISLAGEALNERSLVTKVETLKALSTLDTEESLILIKDTLARNDGWIREICIQMLGKSENELAREFLKGSLSSLRSGKAFAQARYFLPYKLWLRLYVLSLMTIDNVINTFQYTVQALFALVPFIYFTMIYKGANYFKLSPTVFIGRVMSMIWLIKIIGDIGSSLKETYRAKKKITFRTLLHTFHTGNIILTIFAVFTWVFPLETILICFTAVYLFLFVFTAYVIIAILRNMFSVRKLGKTLTGVATIFILPVIIMLLSVAITKFYPNLRTIPTSEQKKKSVVVKDANPSVVSSWIEKADNYIIYKPLMIAYKVMLIIGSLSIIAFFITYMLYIRLSRLKKRWRKQHKKVMLEPVFVTVESPYWWSKIKMRALKTLRDVTIDEAGITRLENYNTDDDDVRRELERTVYELRAKA